MPQPSLVTKPINAFYYGYLQHTEPALSLTNGHAEDLERLLLQCVRESFTAGARWQMRTTSQLSPYISRFLEMVILLGPDPGRDDWLNGEFAAANCAESDETYEPMDEWLEHAPF